MISKGQIFANRYELLKQLGRGGFSEVWLACDKRTSVNVAIKIYAPSGGLDEAGMSLFMQEFALVFDMNHTNLLRPTFFDLCDNMPYLILPYCKNGSAFQYVTSPDHIAEEKAWHMLHDVADGLAYLHGKQPPVIHQDIKPDNILITDEGNYMITDFGISTRMRNTLRSTRPKDSYGTLAYMGPERFGKEPLPIMVSDIWSLGAMMFEVLTGNTPFGEHGGLLQKNGAEIPALPDEISPDLRQAIYSCLAKDTWNRPHAKDLAEYAHQHMHNEPSTITFTLDPFGRETVPMQPGGATNESNPMAETVVLTESGSAPDNASVSEAELLKRTVAVKPPVKPSAVEGSKPTVRVSAQEQQPAGRTVRINPSERPSNEDPRGNLKTVMQIVIWAAAIIGGLAVGFFIAI